MKYEILYGIVVYRMSIVYGCIYSKIIDREKCALPVII